MLRQGMQWLDLVNGGGYFVNEYSLNLFRSATIDSILYAYCYENDTDLSDRLNEYVKENI